MRTRTSSTVGLGNRCGRTRLGRAVAHCHGPPRLAGSDRALKLITSSLGYWARGPADRRPDSPDAAADRSVIMKFNLFRVPVTSFTVAAASGSHSTVGCQNRAVIACLPLAAAQWSRQFRGPAPMQGHGYHWTRAGPAGPSGRRARRSAVRLDWWQCGVDVDDESS